MSGSPPIAREETQGEKITRRLGLFLSRWGVEAAQYHWLLQASLKMDFRSSGGPWAKAGDGNTKSTLLKTALFNMVFSAIMSLMFAMFADSFFFTAIMIGYAMAMLAMMILVEFGLVVISPDDHLILGYRPISSRTFLAVRFSNLMFYVLILGLSLSVAPAFAGMLCKHASFFFPVVYLFASVAGSMFIAGAVVAFYGLLMRWFNYEKFKDVLVYCQVVLSFMFFFGYQLLPRLAGRLSGMDIINVTHHWGLLFPSVWFAGLVELGLGHWSREALLAGAIGIAVTFLLIPGLLRAISLDYSEHIGQVITGSKKPAAAISTARGKLNFTGWVARLVVRDNEERAFFCFISTMLARNRQVKLQLFPMFGYMIAMFVLGIMDSKSSGDPFSTHGNPVAGSFAGMGFILLGSSLARLLPYSDEYAGAWLFQMAPVSKPAVILNAIKKAAFVFLFLPLLLLNVVLFSFVWPILHAFELGVYGLLSGLIGFQLLLFQFKGFPFSSKPEKGNQSSQFAGLMLIFGLFGFVFALPLLVSWSRFAAQIAMWATCGAMALLSLILGEWNNRHFAARGLAKE